jgi:hypothetical protein
MIPHQLDFRECVLNDKNREQFKADLEKEYERLRDLHKVDTSGPRDANVLFFFFFF